METNLATMFNLSPEMKLIMLYLFLSFNLVLTAVVIYLLKDTILLIQGKSEKTAEERASSTSKILQALTDTVPIENEASIEMDHEYDGIRELDNNLPPWWKWGFYLTIVIAVVYIGYYHFGSGDLQKEEYDKEIAQAESDISEYLISQSMNVDETNVELLTEAESLEKGKAIFLKYCSACHGKEAEGRIGPNLTDKHWIYVGDVKGVFKTIKYGAKNGMKSWKDELNPVQMQEVTSFIKSLEGTNPANAKAPEGTLYEN